MEVTDSTAVARAPSADDGPPAAGTGAAASPAEAPRVADAVQIVLLGGGRHAKVCVDLLRQLPGYRIVGILDSLQPIGAEVLGVPVLGRDSEENLRRLREEGVRCAVNAVGGGPRPEVRGEVFRRLKTAGFLVPNLIHPRAAVEPSAVMGEGNQILANAIVGSAVRIGDDCLVNCGANVSHDCVLEDHVHLAPGAILAGGVHVGGAALIGMAATIFMDVHIGRGARINNGTAVFADVPDGAIVKR
jgi:sugar O-acyltransferase (sialic acid O-acetyltransferase NeuD family)